MHTLTVGKRGTIVIPKAIRTACKMDEGAQVEVNVADHAIVITPSIYARTEMDDNFDKMREILVKRGVTLEGAMQTLREHRAANG
jgi:AbrB family looped-hinge helix DNA binding protein